MFEQSLAKGSGGVRRSIAFLVSSMGQVLLVLLLVVVPLISTSEIPRVVFAAVLKAPGVPPPPPPRAKQPAAAQRAVPLRRFTPATLLAPRVIPKKVAMIVDELPPRIEPGIGVAGGMGVPGGDPGGVIGSILAGAGSRPLPPPPVKPKMEPSSRARVGAVLQVLVGGDVRPPVLQRHVRPAYPRLARQARISGTVRLDCIIATNGGVKDLRVVSGHPLLVRAALEAVRQWRFQPTLLNGEPVEVRMQVDVNFHLGG